MRCNEIQTGLITAVAFKKPTLHEKTNQPTCVGKRWNKLACKPWRGRSRCLWENADETRQRKTEDTLVGKLLFLIPQTLLISTSLACWIKTGPTDLYEGGFFITGASVQLLRLHGKLRHDKNDEGGGTEKEKSEMDGGRSFRPWCQGPLLPHDQPHEGGSRWWLKGGSCCQVIVEIIKLHRVNVTFLI